MNAVIRLEDPGEQVQIRQLHEPGRRGAVFVLSGEAPSTAARLAALSEVLGHSAERGYKTVVLHWCCSEPLASEFLGPALNIFLSSTTKGMRVGTVSEHLSDYRVLESLAIECIVSGLNVQHFEDMQRATRWARFL